MKVPREYFSTQVPYNVSSSEGEKQSYIIPEDVVRVLSVGRKFYISLALSIYPEIIDGF